MAKAGLDKSAVIAKAAELANAEGLDAVTLKSLAEVLGIQSPSLYNYVGSLSELKKELMLYGWRQLEERMLRASAGVSGYEALREMSRAFYKYARENKGVFDAALRYNKFADGEAMAVTTGLFDVVYRIFEGLNISRENAEHLIRTMRGFLEGFSLLVNNDAFGNPVSVEKSFELSLDVLIEGMKALEGK